MRELSRGPAMGRHLLTPVAVPIPTFRLLLVSVSALLFAFLLGSSHGVAALTIPIPVVAAPEPAAYDADKDEEYRVNSVEEENSKLGEEEVTRLKQRILEGLGLTSVPDVSKVSETYLKAALPISALVFARVAVHPLYGLCFVHFLTFPLKIVFYQMFGKPQQSERESEGVKGRKEMR